MLSVVRLVVISVIFIIVQIITTESVSLREFYPFRTHDKRILGTDDGASMKIPLDPPLRYYGKSYNVCRVVNNGAVSFGSPPLAYRTDSFPLKRFVMIAPFYGDVDTRNGGETIYTEPVSTDTAVLERVKKDIEDVFCGDFDNFSPKYVVIATWYRVGYFNQKNDKVNTFQCVITTDGVQSFAIFLYNEIQWVLEYDPPYPAKVGFSDGISNKSYELPGSGTPEIINITKRSNVGRPGVWMYRIDGENISSTRPITECVNCSTPTHPINGTIEPYDFTQVGAIIQFHCNKSYAPTKWRTAECQLNGTWAPDPARLICTFKRSNDSQLIDGENISSTHPMTKGVNCTTPTHPINGTIEPYDFTQVGAIIQFHCNKSYAPTKWRTAECQLNGTWAPDPARLICTFKRSNDSQSIDGENISSTHQISKGVNCTTPTHPINGTIEPYDFTQVGAIIQFHCNKSYAPTKWRRAECRLNGTWAPDPAQLICTFKRRSHDSQLLVKYSVISAIAVVFIVGQGAGVIYITIFLIKRKRK